MDNPGLEIDKVEGRLKSAFVGIASLFVVIVILAIFLAMRWQELNIFVAVITIILLAWSLAVMFYAFDSLHRTSHNIRERLENLTFIDDATGVYNYRYLHIRLKEEFERIRRYGGATALLYLDLDKFKLVNDRYGHQMGNNILSEVAQLLNRTIRGCDIIGRIGGDEFLIILPETDSNQGSILGERMRANVEEYTYEMRNHQIIDFVRLSVGIASYPRNGDTIEHVIHAADDAVYQAKAKGGNTVCIAQDYIGDAPPATASRERNEEP